MEQRNIKAFIPATIVRKNNVYAIRYEGTDIHQSVMAMISTSEGIVPCVDLCQNWIKIGEPSYQLIRNFNVSELLEIIYEGEEYFG